MVALGLYINNIWWHKAVIGSDGRLLKAECLL